MISKEDNDDIEAFSVIFDITQKRKSQLLYRKLLFRRHFFKFAKPPNEQIEEKFFEIGARGHGHETEELGELRNQSVDHSTI